MKRNDVLRFIIHHRSLYKFFSQFRWFNALVIKRAKEIIWSISEPQERSEQGMTVKEAIGIWLPMVLIAVHDSPQCEEAVKMAARALEQEPVLDKIMSEIEVLPKTYPFVNHIDTYVKEDDVKKIIDKYKAESEGQ